MTYEKHEGILLQAIPYLGNHRILTLFTPQAGIIPLIAKQVKSKQLGWASPFCRAEWVVRTGRSDLAQLSDARLLDPFSELRSTYATISSAASMAKDLLSSQLPHKASPTLYALLEAYLPRIPNNPTALACSFRLKLLQCDGLLRLQPSCTTCGRNASILSGGESVCISHSLSQRDTYRFNTEEWSLLLQLGLSRNFSEIIAVSAPNSVTELVAKLFLTRRE